MFNALPNNLYKQWHGDVEFRPPRISMHMYCASCFELQALEICESCSAFLPDLYEGGGTLTLMIPRNAISSFTKYVTARG